MPLLSVVDLCRRFVRVGKSRGWRPAMRDAGRHVSGQISLVAALPGRLLRSRPAEIGNSTGLPSVSIVLSTWNRSAMLARAIDSVLAQSRQDWELIVVDDGSEDDTPALLAAYGRDPRILALRQDHAGPGAARNAALARARGPIIAYIDSDNEWRPDYLETMLPVFEERSTVQSAYCAIRRLGLDGSSLVHLTPFDAALLEERNFIDLNVFCHRRELFQKLGGFDPALPRLNDWDLVRRYARFARPHAVAFVGAQYHDGGWPRLSNTESKAYAEYLVRRKDAKPLPGRLKVLYALWHYPQLSESYIQTEIGYMTSQGVDIEVWSEIGSPSPHPVDVPVHRGSLRDAIARVRPDLVHVHWLNSAVTYADMLRKSGLPLTARCHGFEFTAELARDLGANPQFHALFVFPHHKAAMPDLAKLQAIPSAFDPNLYRPPVIPKDRRLVLRVAAGLPTKDLESLFDLARRLPEFRFVLAVVLCNQNEDYVENLLRTNEELGRPVDLRVNMSHPAVAALAQQAGIYLHTFDPAGPPYGMPTSICEAMASGAYIVARRLAPAEAYVGEAGRLYDTKDEAEAALRETLSWSDADWQKAMLTSVDRAYRLYVDSIALRPILDCWRNLVRPVAAAQADFPLPLPARRAGTVGTTG